MKSGNNALKCPEPILLIVGKKNKNEWLIGANVIRENMIVPLTFAR